MADKDYASLLEDSLSPLTAAGIDPDEARANPAATMAKLRGSDPNVASQETWLDQIRKQAAQPGASSPQSASATPPATAAVPAQVTQGGSPKSWSDLQRGIVSQGEKSMGAANDALTSLVNQPTEDQIIAPLEQKRSQVVAPINPNDYKPSFGQRLIRGLQGFARGGVLGVIDPTIDGGAAYGAPTKQFGIAKDQQAQTIASIDQQIAQKRDAFKAASERAKAIGAEARSNAGIQKDISGAITGQEGAETAQARLPIEKQQADAETARAYNDSPQGKAEAAKELNEQSLQQRLAQIKDPNNPVSRASKSDQAYFMANGKLPEPDRYHAPAEIQMFGKAYGAWQAQNPGKQPTIDDLRNITAASKGETGGTNLMVPNGKGGFTSTIVRPGDTVPDGSTTVAGMVGNSKTAGKERQAAQSIVDEADLAHQAATEADKGNAEGDVDLALAYFKTIKGTNGSGIRFTQQEADLIKGARNTAGDLQAVSQKVIGGGQTFTPGQRQNILKIIDIHADQARKHMGNTPSTSGDSGSSSTDHDIEVKPEDMH